MYRVWCWTVVDRDSEDRFIACIPDLGDVTAWGMTEKDAVAHVSDLAAEHVRALVESGRRVPHRRHAAEMPSLIRSKELDRALIPVEVGRSAAWPTPPYNLAP